MKSAIVFVAFGLAPHLLLIDGVRNDKQCHSVEGLGNKDTATSAVQMHASFLNDSLEVTDSSTITIEERNRSSVSLNPKDLVHSVDSFKTKGVEATQYPQRLGVPDSGKCGRCRSKAWSCYCPNSAVSKTKCCNVGEKCMWESTSIFAHRKCSASPMSPSTEGLVADKFLETFAADSSYRAEFTSLAFFGDEGSDAKDDGVSAEMSSLKAIGEQLKELFPGKSSGQMNSNLLSSYSDIEKRNIQWEAIARSSDEEIRKRFRYVTVKALGEPIGGVGLQMFDTDLVTRLNPGAKVDESATGFAWVYMIGIHKRPSWALAEKAEQKLKGSVDFVPLVIDQVIASVRSMSQELRTTISFIAVPKPLGRMQANLIDAGFQTLGKTNPKGRYMEFFNLVRCGQVRGALTKVTESGLVKFGEDDTYIFEL